MAYSATVTVNRLGSDTQVTISETDVGAADEATIAGIPLHGTILRQQCTLTGGPATTVSPILAAVPGGSGQNVIVENATPAASVDNADPKVAYADADGTAYHRSRPDAGATNTVESVYLIKGGW